jgi:hypothetical protein
MLSGPVVGLLSMGLPLHVVTTAAADIYVPTTSGNVASSTSMRFTRAMLNLLPRRPFRSLYNHLLSKRRHSDARCQAPVRLESTPFDLPESSLAVPQERWSPNVWGSGERTLGSATWSDERCRTITIMLVVRVGDLPARLRWGWSSSSDSRHEPSCRPIWRTIRHLPQLPPLGASSGRHGYLPTRLSVHLTTRHSPRVS